jgi:AcrR family transcriptional regulator
MGPSGRRPGTSGARQAILRAAREQFGRHGYDAATIRGIAAQAGVDPALVHHYFGTKEGVFVEAMRLPFRPSEIVDTVHDDAGTAGERLVRLFLSVWESPASRDALQGLIRSAVSHEQAASMLREFITKELIGRVATVVDRPDAQLRGALVGAHMIGLGMLRYVLRVEPLASADPDDLVALIGPTLQRYLTG